MKWLNEVAEAAIARQPEGEIIVQSGGSPSGSYHLGHLRELVTSDAILRKLKKRGRQAKHVYFVDDLDALRKVPPNVPPDYEKYLGKSLCDIPAPDGSANSYADYFLEPFIHAAKTLGLEIEFIRSHQKYRGGFFSHAIEAALEQSEKIRDVLENVSGHKLGQEWSPVQIDEDGYLKKRKFLSLDKDAKTINYEDKDGQTRSISYAAGQVKLDWRIDWPARWWLMGINVEPFGRDHATKGGSYDTGAALCREVFKAEPPIPVPYDFVNLAGDSKKMSASQGTGLDAEGVVKILPPEIVRYFMIQYTPSKRLYFDPENGVAKLIDEFSEELSTDPDSPAVQLAREGLERPVVSSIPFSLLAESYQAALGDNGRTIEIISRTDYADRIPAEREVITAELAYIDQWLKNWAPEDSKFELRATVDDSKFTKEEKNYLARLADAIEKLPADADGDSVHKTIYAFKESDGFTPSQLFGPLYRALIGKTSGPRAGWFLAILPREWLIKRLRFEA